MRLLPWRDREDQARKAAEEAARVADEIKAQTPRYRALARSLVEIQKTNHLGASAARILRGER